MAFTAWYLQQAIADQICIGFFLIFFVGSMYSIIVYCLFSYGMIVYSLQTQKYYYETNEYHKIESTTAFINQQLFLYDELSKLGIQVIRELIDTLDTPIHTNLNNLMPHTSTQCSNNVDFKVICYIDPVPSNDLCEKLNKNMLQIHQIIKTINSIELPWFGGHRLISDLSIYVDKCTTYYFITKQNKEYYTQIEDEYNTSYGNAVNAFNKNTNILLKDYYSTIGVDPNDKKTPRYHPYVHYINSNISSVYRHKDYGLTVINGIMIANFIEYLTANVLKSFPSHSLIITALDPTMQRELVISSSSCLYLLTIQSIASSKTNNMTSFSLSELYESISSIDSDNFTIDLCFIENKTKEDMIALGYVKSNNSETDANQGMDLYLLNNYHLKRRVSLGQYHLESPSSSQENYYKVIKSSYPDSNVLMSFHSSFFNYEQYSFYSLYPNLPASIRFLPISNRALSLSLFIILFLTIFWRLINIGLYFAMHKISSDVTTPLNQLKTSVESMTLNDDSRLEFKDDDDINDLFRICKDILKGALIIHNKPHNDDKENRADMKKSIESNVIVNQSKIDENPSKTNILNCSSKWIMTYGKSKDRAKTAVGLLERRSTQVDTNAVTDSNKRDFIHLAEVICNLRSKKENILFNCYAKVKQEKTPLINSTNTILTSMYSGFEKKESQANISSKGSLKPRRIEFNEEGNKTLTID